MTGLCHVVEVMGHVGGEGSEAEIGAASEVEETEAGRIQIQVIEAEVSLPGEETGGLTEGLVSVVTPEEEETEEEHVVVVVTGVGGVVISGGVVEEVPPALSPAISGLTLIGLEGHVEQCAVRTDFIDLGSVFKMTVYWRLKSLNF